MSHKWYQSSIGKVKVVWVALPDKGRWLGDVTSKVFLIDIGDVDAPLDYNILLGCSNMYYINVIASLVFHTMIFPHNGKIMSLDQFMYYDPKPKTNLENIFYTLGGNQPISSYIEVGLDNFKESTFLGTYQGTTLQVYSTGSSVMCTITSFDQALATLGVSSCLETPS
jgi:hypothetical protein